jgi:catechol 2,3-dioxygenase-like lactoylglutathione lyase family enzyme
MNSQKPAVGRLYHTGYVVGDVHAAVRHWVEVAGVGPFVLFENFEFVNPVYRDALGGPRVTLAFGAVGDHCIELIQPLDEAPSIYTELPGALHHVGLLVPDLESGVRRYTDAGVTCAFRAAFPFGGGCAYLDTRATLGVFTELVEGGAVVEGMLAGMRDAHARWNRRDYTFALG